MADTHRDEEHCQAETLKLLGDYITLRIVDHLRSSEMRFTELQRTIGDTNSVTLTNRLKRLESYDLIERKEATVDRQSVVYGLTPAGRSLLPVIAEIQQFARNFERLARPTRREEE
jgi:DNA-binding HxlR family transcriptional regulator